MADSWTIASTIAGIVVGFGTAGALIVAAITLRTQQKDSQRRQASRVTLSADQVSRKQPDGSNISLVEWRVDNLSDLPIYNVNFHGRTSLYKPPPEESKDYVQRLGPNEHMTALFESEKNQELSGGYAYTLAAVWFTDAAGVRWRRNVKGGLKREPHRSYPDEWTMDPTRD